MNFVLRCLLVAMFGLFTSEAYCQEQVVETEEVMQLRAEIELLKQENQLLKNEIKLLQEDDEVEADEEQKQNGKAKSLSDLIVKGTILKGTFRAHQGGGNGEITITVSERTANKFKANAQRVQMQNNVFVANAEGEIEGRIQGNKLLYWNVGASNKVGAELRLTDGALEGKYKAAAGVTGDIGLKFVKE